VAAARVFCGSTVVRVVRVRELKLLNLANVHGSRLSSEPSQAVISARSASRRNVRCTATRAEARASLPASLLAASCLAGVWSDFLPSNAPPLALSPRLGESVAGTVT